MISNQDTTSSTRPGDPLQDLLRAARVCHPGWQSVGRITFTAGLAMSPPWAGWRDTMFLPVLLPALERARRAGACGDARELEACDEFLSKSLPASPCALSRAAGAALAEAFTVPVGERLLARYGQRILRGEVPGHLATLLGLRTAVFHLPAPSLFGVYVLMEAKGGLKNGGPSEWMEMTNDCLKRQGDAGGSQLRAA